MTARARAFSAALLVLGIILGWLIGRVHSSVSGSAVEEACTELAEELSNKCHEAEQWHVRLEKKYPDSANKKENEEALKSREWERAMSWSQACDEAKEELAEAIIAASEPTPKSSPE